MLKGALLNPSTKPTTTYLSNKNNKRPELNVCLIGNRLKMRCMLRQLYSQVCTGAWKVEAKTRRYCCSYYSDTVSFDAHVGFSLPP